ncbi:hypothetical protein HZP25_15665 [Elizabethkingia anophelis]|nr:hypothetical protein [Elizabethkingia anophelis]
MMQTNRRKASLLLLLLFIIFSCHSSSQDEYDKNFDLPLLKKSRELLFMGDYNAFLDLQRYYFDKADRDGYKEGKAICYIQLFKLNLVLSDFDRATFFLKKADNILRNTKNKAHQVLLYEAYIANNNSLGMVDNAMYYCDKALSILENMRESELRTFLLAGDYSRKGSLLNNKGQQDSVVIYFHKAMTVRKDLAIEGVIADYYLQINKMDSAYYYLRQTENMLASVKDKESSIDAIIFYINKGKYFDKKEQYKEAEEAYLKALQANGIKKKVFGVFNLYNILSVFYNKIGDDTKSQYYASLFLKEKVEIDNNKQVNINPAVGQFIEEIKRRDVITNRKMWVYIVVLGIFCLGSGIYTYKQISALRRKKKLLRNGVNKLNEQIGDQKYDEMIALAKKNDSAFLVKFQEIYPDYINRLKDRNPDLENSELIFAALIKLNFTSKEIASFTFIEHASVQQRKRRLRKRLNIPSEVDLYRYFNEI